MTYHQTFDAIDSLPHMVGETGTGIYLLTACESRIGPSDQTRCQLRLEDATGRITGIVWPEHQGVFTCPALPSPVAVDAVVQPFDGHVQLHVHAMRPLTAEHVPNAAALLPYQQCPQAAVAALNRLIELEWRLPSPLDDFLREVLLDPRIGVPLLRCRASVRHHHAFIGGLLVHSTEMLPHAARLTEHILPEDLWSLWLAQLAYLLHDLGKLKTVGESRRPLYGLTVGHEFLTIELLAPHLQWLEQRRPELATALRYVFEHLATPARARAVPKHAVAEIVVQLDQWSAAGYNQRDLAYLLNSNALDGLSPIASPREVSGLTVHE